MNNARDKIWDAVKGNGLAYEANDNAYPAYQFLCDKNPLHSADEISDEYGVWTYSTLNDAMFYGTIVYDTFLKYLGEPALEGKIRLRVHYGPQTLINAYWDGAYANFSDAYPYQYSTASLDVIAHEIGHGVLNRISAVNFFADEMSTDARTLHEAFADLSGVMAKYEFTGDTNIWTHGEESAGITRKLDHIETQAGAIDSWLDYDDAGNNYYWRIGIPIMKPEIT
jgi:vibriolysin